MSGQPHVIHRKRRRDVGSFRYNGLSRVIQGEVKVQLSQTWQVEFSSELAKLSKLSE